MGVVVVFVAGVEEVARGIQHLGLHLGGAGDVARVSDSRRRGALRYIGPNTRPPHVTNKQGFMRASCDTVNDVGLCFILTKSV